MTQAARAAVDADDHVADLEPENSGDRAVVERGHTLHLEVMVARPKRAHLIALTLLRRVRHGARIGAPHFTALFDALEVLGTTVAFADRPTRATGEHRVRLRGRETQRARTAHASRDARVKRIGQRALDPLDLRDLEARQ